MPYRICTITGHRPQRFKFKYNEHYKLCIKIKKSLTAEIINFYNQGVRIFWIGGSIGVDTWAGEIIAELKKQKEYGDMSLCVALPFPTFTKRYDAKQQTRLRDILRACDKQIIICDEESKTAYRIRNEYMVNQSDCVLAVYDNDRYIRNGTGMTVNYVVKKRGLPSTFIHPDTAIVTRVSLDKLIPGVPEDHIT